MEVLLILALFGLVLWAVVSRRRRGRRERPARGRLDRPVHQRHRSQPSAPATRVSRPRSGASTRTHARPRADVAPPGAGDFDRMPFVSDHMRGPLFTYAGTGKSRGHSAQEGPFAVIDVETTGLSPGRGDRIIEIAIARVDARGQIEDEYATLIDPQGRDTGPVFIHGITNDALRGAPTFDQVIGEVLARMQGAVVVAHNAVFEERFLQAEFARIGLTLPQRIPALCTLWLGQRALSTPNHKLTTLCRHYGIPLVDKHAALGDVRATARLLPIMFDANRAALSYAAAPIARFPNLPLNVVVPRTRAVSMRKGNEGWMHSLLSRLPMTAAEASDAQAQAYLDALEDVLEDGKIIGTEAKLLAKLAGAAGMGAAQVASLNHRYLETMHAVALEDGVITATELRELKRAARALGQPGAFDDVQVTSARSTRASTTSHTPSPHSTPQGLTNDRSRQARVERAKEAVRLQRSGMSRDEVAQRLGISTHSIKKLLRDGRFYLDPTTDTARLMLVQSAAEARTSGTTMVQFGAEHGLSGTKAQEAWRDADILHTPASGSSEHPESQ